MADVTESTVNVLGVLFAGLTLAVTIVGGFVKFLHGRIVGVEEKADALAGELRQAMQTQASDHRLEQSSQANAHRNVQDELWKELRRIADLGHIAHTAMAEAMTKNQITLVEAMGKLATREETERAQHAMETRIMDTLRKEVGNR